jgi:hypothetical protein
MRLSFLSLALIASLSFAQNIPVAPVPTSPYELVTGPVKLLDETDQRASVLGLIERARQNSDLHAPGGHAYLLKASFEAAGNVPYTGSGQLEELWYAPGQWRWTTNFGSYVQTRINLQGRIFDEIDAPMPLRVHMVRGTIVWPIIMRPGAVLRISAGTWKGAPVMCVLGSRSLGDDAALPGRRWEETEFSIDPKTGLLQTYSIAPGIYAVYDYSDAIHFHASTLPRTISIYEGTTAVLNIRLDSLTDAGTLDPRLFTPTPAMKSRGHGSMIAGTVRFPLSGGVSPVPTNVIQPVIVHVSVTGEGKAEEVESLQTSDPTLSAAAIAAVKNAHFSDPEGGRGGQREVFVNVRFTPPTAQPGQ